MEGRRLMPTPVQDHLLSLGDWRHPIDESQLSSDERRQLDASKQFHTMIELSIASGKRTLKAMNAGKLKLSGKD
jgi:hypothetical protein